ncbi:hypothetical protein QCB45_10010 [Thiomicrorhabdus sp. ZW0627]|uniref:hypothetical protein n=1 Tax=Thiomicrorhabdus sp. ZW0627 TaxID=3039774 RepID=UPI002436E4FD|nr:hypothetical protein [Thiomicrorhabdus sp. ZW0627]MDG6774666.1 hypothetical protein [Thiomicrorhabdus sp. ZW0627]
MSENVVKRFIGFIAQINPNVRKRTATITILLGIAMAYSPYWVHDIVEKEMAVDVSNVLLSIGWWVLGFGLLLYFFNLWSDVKSEKDEKES